MNRFVFGRGWIFCDETNGEGDGNGDAGGAAGDGAAQVDDAVGAGDGEGAGAADGADKGAGKKDGGPAAGAPKDMLAAIDAGLGYKKGPNGEALDALTGKPKVTPEKAGEKKGEQPPAGAVEKHANGKPKKDAAGNELDENGAIVKAAATAKAKTAAELDLKPEEKKGLHAKTQARFSEVITTLKAHEGTIAKQADTIKTLSEAREAIVGLLQETRTTHEQFGQLLEFNGLLQSGDPKKIERALEMVEAQRLAIYKVLGREPEGGGIDLLADFPDLKKQVDDSQITRAAALEIAQGRRDKAARDHAAQQQQQQQRQQTQTAEQRKQSEDKALDALTAWTTELTRSDIDYKAKEDILLANVEEVIAKYPPQQWLPTLKLLYAGIKITKAALPSGGGPRPLRPSGAKPGAKAPVDMKQAIDQGLGYATPGTD